MLRRRPAFARRRLARLSVAVVLALSVATVSTAEIVFLDQLRRVQAFAGATDGTDADTDSDVQEDTGVGSLSQFVDAEVTIGEVVASSTAGQASEIGPGLILISGEVDATIAADPDIPESGGEVGMDAFLTSRFEVTGPIEYTLSGILTTEGEGTASVILQGPEGVVFIRSQSKPGTLGLGLDGVLMPGVYTYDVITGQFLIDTGELAEPRFARAHVYVGLIFRDEVAVPGAGDAPAGVRVFPNPAVAGAPVAFELPGDGAATIRVVDVNGRLVDRFVRGDGTGSIRWDAVAEGRAPLPSGVYFVEVLGARGRAVERITVLER